MIHREILMIQKINILILLLTSVTFYTYSESKFETPKHKTELCFKENKGQIGDQFSKPRPDILFSGNAGNLTFHLRNNGISYQMFKVNSWKEVRNDSMLDFINHHASIPDKITCYRLDINWLNVNPNAIILKENPLQGYENYYNEVCPNGVTDVQSYKNINYRNIYDGIDLKWYEKNGNLKYDYVVDAGVDHKKIQMEVKGAETVSVNNNGELIIKTPLGVLTEKAPFVTQTGKQMTARWHVEKNIISFDILNVDSSQPLVIDPLIRLWGTYYGGSDDDYFSSVVTDSAGNIYVSGDSNSTSNIATVGSYQSTIGPAIGRNDAILVKFNSSGARLWATYYGGEGYDWGNSCDVDPTGNYVAMIGGTSTTLTGVMATPGSHQPNFGGNASSWSGDAFLAVFNNSGIRQWGTYYGGSADEYGLGCCFDLNGDVYIAGATSSTNAIASPGSHQAIYGGTNDGYLAKFNNAGTRQWGTYYGGALYDWINNCTSDNSGNVFVTGYARSTTGIGTAGTHQPSLTLAYSWGDGLVAKFNSSGVRQWGTYYGGGGEDLTHNSACDSNGNIYVSGYTTGPSQSLIATPGSHQSTFGGGGYDAFLLKLTPTGTRMWCTFYGGRRDENINWCSVDHLGNVYLTGCTTSTDAISTPCAYQENYGGAVWPSTVPQYPVTGGDAYLAKFDSSGARMWGTYYGGAGFEFTYVTCTTDFLGNVYVVGSTNSTTGTAIASLSSYQPLYGGGASDGFLAKFDGCIPNPANTTSVSDLTICSGKSATLTTNRSCDMTWFDAQASGNAIGSGSLFTTPTLTTTTTLYFNDATCGSNTVRASVTITVDPLPNVSIDLVPSILCYKTSINAKANGAVSYTWFPDKWINCTNCSDPVLTPLETMQYCVEGMDNNSCVGKLCKTIEVDFARAHDFSLPNALSPNGDGNNDSFCLQGWDICNDSFTIRIFDRWGEQVFKSSDPNFCWDGTYNGKLLSNDVFVYSVSATYKDGTNVNKKGNITLIR
jgi:gliding motility-associated-like protein